MPAVCLACDEEAIWFSVIDFKTYQTANFKSHPIRLREKKITTLPTNCITLIPVWVPNTNGLHIWVSNVLITVMKVTELLYPKKLLYLGP